jgi:hypothetical protein
MGLPSHLYTLLACVVPGHLRLRIDLHIMYAIQMWWLFSQTLCTLVDTPVLVASHAPPALPCGRGICDNVWCVQH